MNNKKKVIKPVKPFNPKDLTIEQQEEVVKEYLGVHPDYFLYKGQNIKLNWGRYESDNRRIEKETGNPRVIFNGWKPKGKR